MLCHHNPTMRTGHGAGRRQGGSQKLHSPHGRLGGESRSATAGMAAMRLRAVLRHAEFRRLVVAMAACLRTRCTRAVVRSSCGWASRVQDLEAARHESAEHQARHSSSQTKLCQTSEALQAANDELAQVSAVHGSPTATQTCPLSRQDWQPAYYQLSIGRQPLAVCRIDGRDILVHIA